MKLNDKVLLVLSAKINVVATVTEIDSNTSFPSRISLAVTDGDTVLNGEIEAAPGDWLSVDDVIQAAREGAERFDSTPLAPAPTAKA